MFEKEAEELIEESKRLNTTPRETVCKAIEFGFQKGIKAKINTTTISDCPIKDEWHKITDWEDNSQFPNDESETYLVRLYQDDYVVCELDITEGCRQFYLVGNLEPVYPQDVIAWKEIVPPKEEL